MRKLMWIAAAALMTLAPVSASAQVHRGFVSHRRVVVVGRPYFGGWYGGWYRPFWEPYWGGYYYANPDSGEVKLETKVKDAEVFINGSYAGTTHQNKTMHLRPGNYKIEIREGGSTAFAQDVYVTAGKTLKLYPEL